MGTSHPSGGWQATQASHLGSFACLFSALCYRLLQTFFYNCLKYNFVFPSVEGSIQLAVLCHLWSPLQGPLVALPAGTLSRDQHHCAPGLGTLSPAESRVP